MHMNLFSSWFNGDATDPTSQHWGEDGMQDSCQVLDMDYR